MKIAIGHFRVGKTDGVSLEIEKRKLVLERMGHTVELISGTQQVGASVIIPELEFDQGLPQKVCNNGNLAFTDYGSLEDYQQDFNALVEAIKRQLSAAIETRGYDLWLVHNVLSSGRHPPATVALAQIIEELKIPTLSTDHDLYWERGYSLNPALPFVKETVRRWVLPSHPWVRHVVINSLAQRELFDRHGIQAALMPDSLDFDQPAWAPDEYNSSFKADLGIDPGDLVVLQATRITPRKGIELAVDFAAELQELYPDRRVFFLLANYVEGGSEAYAEKLAARIKALGLTARFGSDRIEATRSEKVGQKIYSFWDAYAFADMVTFTSLQEGWGNQFIEAVFAKKPVVVFEYAVFKSDIRPEGYEVLSLGGECQIGPDGLVAVSPIKTRATAEQAQRLLSDPVKLARLTERNFEIGRQNHSFQRLQEHLETEIGELKHI